MIDPQRPTSKVTLEDLLRFKRAERPPAEFWIEFEHTLRAKQLAAIVEKRPWWRTISGFSRWSIPLGAAAALSITFVSLQRSPAPAAASADLAKVQSGPSPAVASEHMIPVSAEVASVAASPVALPAAPAEAVSVSTHVVREAEASRLVADSSSAPQSQVPLATVSERIAGIASDSRTEDQASAEFASVTTSSTPSLASLGAYFDRAVAHFGESSRKDRDQVVEPLSQLTSPREARRARLLAFGSTVDNRSPQYSDSTNVVRSRERIASHLNEDALYDSLHRLGVKANRVSIQF
jgi:hypothetical protein